MDLQESQVSGGHISPSDISVQRNISKEALYQDLTETSELLPEQLARTHSWSVSETADLPDGLREEDFEEVVFSDEDDQSDVSDVGDQSDVAVDPVVAELKSEPPITVRPSPQLLDRGRRVTVALRTSRTTPRATCSPGVTPIASTLTSECLSNGMRQVTPSVPVASSPPLIFSPRHGNMVSQPTIPGRSASSLLRSSLRPLNALRNTGSGGSDSISFHEWLLAYLEEEGVQTLHAPAEVTSHSCARDTPGL